MHKIISDVISRFSDDYRSCSPTTKFTLIVSLTAAFVIVAQVLFRACSAPPTYPRERLGLSSLSITDANGDQWLLELVKGQPISSFKSGAKAGPPLLIKINVETKGLDALVRLVVEGQAGERYVGGVRKNGKWQPAPKLKIVSETGAILASGKFEYG